MCFATLDTFLLKALRLPVEASLSDEAEEELKARDESDASPDASPGFLRSRKRYLR